MEQSKLKLEDCCLTIEQAKELQKIGIDLEKTIYCYTEVNDEKWRDIHLYPSDEAYDIKTDCDKISKGGILLIPTLTNTEMMEMLPKEIGNYQLKVVPFDYGYCVEYELYMEHIVYIGKDGGALDFCFSLLRDALFEMIKCLKTNKLM